ncbi:MAG: AI-2E family transporter [Caldilineaceae bacterium]|nr:AI-2E family transporter [Caldilineaceae bacterium]
MSDIDLPEEIPTQPEKETYPYNRIQESFLRRTLITIGILALTVVGLWVLWIGLEVVLLVFGGILFAVFLRAATQGLKRVTKLPDKPAVIIVSLLFVALLIGIFWLIGPQISAQFGDLSESFTDIAIQAVETLLMYEWGQQVLDLLPIEETLTTLPTGEADIGIFSTITGVFSQTLDALSSILLVLGIGFFFALDPGLYMRGLVMLFPHSKRELVWEVLRAEEYALRGWLLGTFISMVMIGGTTMLILWAFGVPLAVPMGLAIAILEFVPIIGPIVGTIPVVLLALTVGPDTALWVFFIYFAAQFIEGNIIVPLILQKTVELPPVITVTAQILFGIFAGTLGVLLATPIAAVVMVFIQVVYIRNLLGDPVEVKKTVN